MQSICSTRYPAPEKPRQKRAVIQVTRISLVHILNILPRHAGHGGHCGHVCHDIHDVTMIMFFILVPDLKILSGHGAPPEAVAAKAPAQPVPHQGREGSTGGWVQHDPGPGIAP